MAQKEHTLAQPELFTFLGPDGSPCRGADQEWYRDPWKQKAGCGPTTAAAILFYLARRYPSLAPLAYEGPLESTAFLPYMESVWEHVTPTCRGLHSLDLFWRGSVSFAQSRGAGLGFEALPIGGVHDRTRPGLVSCRAFLANTLDRDLPVAFLNFSNGALQNVESWHWVPLISMTEGEDGRLLCAVLDEGKEKTINFALWHGTTRLGGGLVALFPSDFRA